MKTAMQELIDNLEAIDIKVPIGVKLIFLEKEKEQMFETWKESALQGEEGTYIEVEKEMFEDYYNKTYNK